MIVLFEKKIQNLVSCNLKIFWLCKFIRYTCFFPSTVVHNLTNTFRSTVFNFNKVFFEVNIHDFLFHPNYFSWNCSNSPYVEKDHVNNVAVNLPLIENNILGQLFFKGPKYMETTSVNFHDDIYVNFLSDIL